MYLLKTMQAVKVIPFTGQAYEETNVYTLCTAEAVPRWL